MKSRARPFLIAYDIASPQRWRKLYRALNRSGFAIQYSLFYAELTQAQLARLIETMRAIVKQDEDDLRIYPLPRAGWQCRIGQAVLPAGICYTGLPSRWNAHGPADGLPVDLKSSAIERQGDGDRQAKATASPGPPSLGPKRRHGSSAPRGRGDRTARHIERRLQTGSRTGILLVD